MNNCDVCYGFVYDVLLTPLHPHMHLYGRERPKRLQGYARTVSAMILRIVAKTNPNTYANLISYDTYKNGGRQIGFPIKTVDDSIWLFHRSVRIYYSFLMLNKEYKSDVDSILGILLESMCLANCVDLYYYEQWLAQKLMHILENIYEIHNEHKINHKRERRVSLVPENWYDLYV